jgi:hypothetical protein
LSESALGKINTCDILRDRTLLSRELRLWWILSYPFFKG